MIGTIEYQRETLSFQPVELFVKVDGIDQPITDQTTVEFAVTAGGVRPVDGDWVGALLIGGQLGFMVDGSALGVGYFDVWYRQTDNPDVTVDRTREGFSVI